MCGVGKMIASFTVAKPEMNVGISPWTELTTLSDMFNFSQCGAKYSSELFRGRMQKSSSMP